MSKYKKARVARSFIPLSRAPPPSPSSPRVTKSLDILASIPSPTSFFYYSSSQSVEADTFHDPNDVRLKLSTTSQSSCEELHLTDKLQCTEHMEKANLNSDIAIQAASCFSDNIIWNYILTKTLSLTFLADTPTLSLVAFDYTTQNLLSEAEPKKDNKTAEPVKTQKPKTNSPLSRNQVKPKTSELPKSNKKKQVTKNTKCIPHEIKDGKKLVVKLPIETRKIPSSSPKVSSPSLPSQSPTISLITLPLNENQLQPPYKETVKQDNKEETKNDDTKEGSKEEKTPQKSASKGDKRKLSNSSSMVHSVRRAVPSRVITPIRAASADTEKTFPRYWPHLQAIYKNAGARFRVNSAENPRTPIDILARSSLLHYSLSKKGLEMAHDTVRKKSASTNEDSLSFSCVPGILGSNRPPPSLALTRHIEETWTNLLRDSETSETDESNTRSSTNTKCSRNTSSTTITETESMESPETSASKSRSRRDHKIRQIKSKHSVRFSEAPAAETVLHKSSCEELPKELDTVISKDKQNLTQKRSKVLKTKKNICKRKTSKEGDIIAAKREVSKTHENEKPLKAQGSDDECTKIEKKKNKSISETSDKFFINDKAEISKTNLASIHESTDSPNQSNNTPTVSKNNKKTPKKIRRVVSSRVSLGRKRKISVDRGTSPIIIKMKYSAEDKPLSCEKSSCDISTDAKPLVVSKAQQTVPCANLQYQQVIGTAASKTNDGKYSSATTNNQVHFSKPNSSKRNVTFAKHLPKRVQSHGGGKNQSQVSDKNKSYGGDKNKSLVGDKNKSLGGDKNQSYGGNKNQFYGGEKTQSNGGEKNQSHGGNKNQSLGGDKNKSLGGDKNQSYGGNKNNFYGGEKTQSNGGEKNQSHGGNKNQSLGGNKNQSLCGNKNQSLGRDKDRSSRGRDQSQGGGKEKCSQENHSTIVHDKANVPLSRKSSFCEPDREKTIKNNDNTVNKHATCSGKQKSSRNNETSRPSTSNGRPKTSHKCDGTTSMPQERQKSTDAHKKSTSTKEKLRSARGNHRRSTRKHKLKPNTSRTSFKRELSTSNSAHEKLSTITSQGSIAKVQVNQRPSILKHRDYVPSTTNDKEALIRYDFKEKAIKEAISNCSTNLQESKPMLSSTSCNADNFVNMEMKSNNGYAIDTTSKYLESNFYGSAPINNKLESTGKYLESNFYGSAPISGKLESMPSSGYTINSCVVGNCYLQPSRDVPYDSTDLKYSPESSPQYNKYQYFPHPNTSHSLCNLGSLKHIDKGYSSNGIPYVPGYYFVGRGPSMPCPVLPMGYGTHVNPGGILPSMAETHNCHGASHEVGRMASNTYFLPREAGTTNIANRMQYPRGNEYTPYGLRLGGYSSSKISQTDTRPRSHALRNESSPSYIPRESSSNSVSTYDETSHESTVYHRRVNSPITSCPSFPARRRESMNRRASNTTNWVLNTLRRNRR